MPKLTLALVLVLMAFVAWQAVEGASLRQEVETWQSESAALRADVGRLEKALAAAEARGEPEPMRRSPAGHEIAAPGDGPRLVAKGAQPEVLAQAVRDLQSRVAANEERVTEVAEKVGTSSTAGRAWSRPRMIRSVEDAERELELDAGQRSELERIVDYAKRDLEDLHSLPNADGKTWKEVSELKVTSGGEGLSVVMSNMAEMMKFRNTKVPGSNETFGQADKRIRDRAKGDIRDVLDDDQKKSFDESFTDPLFGGSSGASVVSFQTTATTFDSSDDSGDD